VPHCLVAALRLGAVLLALGAASAAAADARSGRQRAAGVCQACHGMDGLSKHPEAPNLAGQIENYLAKALAEYRGGQRQNEAMNIVAKELTDADIADLAAFYAGIEIEVIPQ
jgi:cytochrome c553